MDFILMIYVLLSLSVFKLLSSFASLCFAEFKEILQIFLFALEISLITKFINVINLTCNILFVMFYKLSCSFAFCVDVSSSSVFFRQILSRKASSKVVCLKLCVSKRGVMQNDITMYCFTIWAFCFCLLLRP